MYYLFRICKAVRPRLGSIAPGHVFLRDSYKVSFRRGLGYYPIGQPRFFFIEKQDTYVCVPNTKSAGQIL